MRERGLGWPSFEGSEMADLIAFLYFLSFVDPPGNPERGERVIKESSCLECHGDPATGAGGDSLAGPSLTAQGAADSPAALVAALWNHAPLMKKAILGKGRRWPQLHGADLRDIRAYLKTSQDSRADRAVRGRH